MHKIKLVFIINGEDYEVEQNENSPLRAARNRALEISKNQGRPPDEWEVRTDPGGVLLDPSAKIEDLKLVNGARLLLTLKIGGGG